MNRRARSWRGLVRVAITVAFALVAVVAAQAQGFFYQEVLKDGRIYVFNDMKAYDNWVKTGDAGRSIVRIGAGPNGETMVFDTEEAIHLYNFKHNVPGEVIAKPAAPFAPTIAWKDGKTTFSFEKAQIVLSNRIQVR